ncbi:hypothetical protein UA45_19035 [Morganella morganii]|uniref:Uncharacterized protein n=1 Tax=Morganella morganii TaxID=582 RepID=A0A0D8L5A6_MORMO|nr:hypothetical protein UA45_19035 [Morganella morganii]
MIFQSQNSNKKGVKIPFLLSAKRIIKLTVIYVMLLLKLFFMNIKITLFLMIYPVLLMLS